MPEDKKDFIIKDRRIFSQENPDKDNNDKVKTQKTTKQESKETGHPAGKTDEKEQEACLPEINFPTFIMSLNASALVNLGILDNPVTEKREINLVLAKQTIDIMCMLEEKTRGNLSSDEESMLKNILYDLRIIYVKEKK